MQKLTIEELARIPVINPTFIVRNSDRTKMREKVTKNFSHKFTVTKERIYYSALCAKQILAELGW